MSLPVWLPWVLLLSAAPTAAYAYCWPAAWSQCGTQYWAPTAADSTLVMSKAAPTPAQEAGTSPCAGPKLSYGRCCSWRQGAALPRPAAPGSDHQTGRHAVAAAAPSWPAGRASAGPGLLLQQVRHPACRLLLLLLWPERHHPAAVLAAQGAACLACCCRLLLLGSVCYPRLHCCPQVLHQQQHHQQQQH